MQNYDLNPHSLNFLRKQQLGHYSNIEYYSQRQSSSVNNLKLQNLQNLKNHISQLQSVLQYSYRKTSFANSLNEDSVHFSNDKSTSLQDDKSNFIYFPQQNINTSDYYIMNQMHSMKAKREKTSQSERINKSILKNNTQNRCATHRIQQQELKELADHNNNNSLYRKQIANNILKECLKQNLHDKIYFLQELKKQKQSKIRQEYKHQKQQIELDCRNQIQQQILNFEKQIKNLVESKNNKSFSQSRMNNCNQPYLTFGIVEPDNKHNKEYQEKTHKLIKVRFQNTEIQKFKTQYD